MTHLPIQGLFAAVATPVRDDGGFDEAAFDRLVDMIVAAGVDGICIGGATGEYPHFESAARVTVIERAARTAARRTRLFSSASARPRCASTIEVGKAALAAGSRALLLPMPMFYRYQQDDLRAYAASVSQELAAPCLLYDLPDFTNGIAPETALALMRDEEFIIGIKDSSGRETNLARFAAAREGLDWTLLVGDDRLLALGLQARWDGGISGLACCCPELLVAIIRSARAGDTSETSRLLATPRRAHRADWGLAHAVGHSRRSRRPGSCDRSAPSAAFSVTA